MTTRRPATAPQRRGMRGVLAVLGLLTVLATLLPVSAAFACSCAPATVAELTERRPDAVVALVRRVDATGGDLGTGEVLAPLHGEPPARLPIQLDDGASCKPFLAPGQVAAIAFAPRGDGWETLDCGMLDLGAAIEEVQGPLRADPAATGPPAVVLAGGLPGADLAVLDDRLRVLTTGVVDHGVWLERLLRCGDDLVTIGRADLDTVVERRSLPDLAVRDRTRLRDPQGWRVLAARCHDGRVVTVGQSDGFGAPLRLHTDVLDPEAAVHTLVPAVAAAFVGDALWLLADDDGATRVHVVDVATGDARPGPRLAGLQPGELHPSPDGRHVAVRGFAEEPTLLVLDSETFAVTGRSRGWWMPARGGWLDDDHLLLTDEGAERGGQPPLRVTDTALRTVAEVEPGPGWVLAAGAGTAVLGGGSELTVVGADGVRARSGDLRLAPAGDGLVLAAVPTGTVDPVPWPTAGGTPAGGPATPGVDGASDVRAGLVGVLAGTTVAALLAAAFAAVARRRR